MSLTYYSVVVAEATVQGLYGRRTIGGYQLSFNVKLVANGWRRPGQTVIMENWAAHISSGRKGLAMEQLGQAYPEAPLILKTFEHVNETYLIFRCELTPQQLAGLEELRMGGELRFQLALSAVCQGTNTWLSPGDDGNGDTNRGQWPLERLPIHDALNYDSQINEWKGVLDQLGFSKLMVFSLALPHGPVAEKLAHAERMLDRAQEDFVYGRYEQVVAISRKLIESVEAALGQSDEKELAIRKFRGQFKDRETMTKVERSLLIREAVRNYAHKAHHVDVTDGAPEYYSRSDATFMLAMAGAIFSEAVACEANISI